MKLLAFLLAFTSLPFYGLAQTSPPSDAQTTTAADTVTYTNKIIGLQFTRPKDWVETTNKKGESRFIIPVPNSSQKAVLELYPVNFRSDKDIWQLSQAGIAKSQKRDVERQWEETILGVPLLLTKVTYSEKGGPEVMLSGLMYTLSTAKLGYRLTATPDDFDRANYEWQQAMQSIRTEDGQMPKPEDPSVELAPRTKDDLAHPYIRNVVSKVVPPKGEKSPVAGSVTLANNAVNVLVPSDWKMDPIDEYKSKLHNPAVPGFVTIQFASSLDSDSPGTALLKASGNTLEKFTNVQSRTEQMPKFNRAAATCVMVWRTGQSSAGPLTTCEAYVQNGDYYALLTYEISGANIEEAKKMVEELIDRLSVEVQK